MAQVIQVIMRLSREKGVVNDAGFVNIVTRVQGVIEGLAYPPIRFAMPEVGILRYPVPPLANAIPKIYRHPYSPMPFGGVYTYFYNLHAFSSNIKPTSCLG